MTEEKKPWIYRHVRGIYYGVWVVCIGLLLLDLTHYKHHLHYAAEEWFGFYGFFGFVGCVGLVLAAKALRVVLMRPEDYYDR